MGKIIKLFILSIMIAGGVFVFYKLSFQKPNVIVTIRPEEGVTRKKPEDPGGLIVPHADSLVYEKLRQMKGSKARKVNLMPDPETPLILQAEESKADMQTLSLDAIDSILNNLEQTEGLDLDNIQEVENAINEGARAKMDLARETSKLFVADDGMNVISTHEVKFADDLLSFKSEQGIKGYSVQLAVASSQEAASEMWNIIAKRHHKILTGVSFISRKVQINQDRIFYLVMAGYYSSLQEAKLACKKLINHKQHCIIVNNLNK